MRAYDIIYKKRNGEELTPEEISFMVQGYTDGSIPDYQMAAWLMAVWYKKMNGKERAQLTLEMLNSGKKFDLSDLEGFKVDKHSTGGVGDGPSLSLAPLVAANGVIVPMMSGRGLGHTGGTLDKLESIEGYSVVVQEEAVKKVLRDAGVVIIGQTDDVAPADKKMYSLRDVTATVDSIDLISGSIMSKKLAEGMDGLVLDVKTGVGAFMQTFDDAANLAKSMVEIGTNLNKKMLAFISDMNQPLGKAIGNGLEMIQAIEILKGRGPADITELVYQIGARMLIMADIVKDVEAGREKMIEQVNNGKGLEVLKKMIAGQKGNPNVVDDYSLFPQASIIRDIPSPESGYISEIHALKAGKSIITLPPPRVIIDFPAFKA